ncbi:uncharacterized protein LOC143365629 [Halictus rubicundus]|uniref:uncharacterized protein LOC143365629 n=1 Tax=Halictus rubicundus TaxID=77578 RepID=UPI004035601C
MCRGKMKVFLLLFVSLVFIPDSYVLSKRYSTEPDGYVDDLSEGFTDLSPLSDEITVYTPTTTSKQKANHKYMELVGRRTSYASLFDNDFDSYLNENNEELHNSVTSTPGASLFKLLFDMTTKDRQWPQFVFAQRLRKRDALNTHDNGGNGMTKRDQKKAKALGRLLLNSVSSRTDEDTQDDYIEDDDDDYTKDANKRRMNWEDYQNEDGASVMELIALNARHKKYMSQNDDYFY